MPVQTSRDGRAEREKQSSKQQQVRYQRDKECLRRVQQQYRAERASNETDTYEDEKDGTWLLHHLAPIRPGASNRAGPDGHCAGRVGYDGRHTCEDQRRKRKKTAATCDRVYRATNNGGHEEE